MLWSSVRGKKVAQNVKLDISLFNRPFSRSSPLYATKYVKTTMRRLDDGAKMIRLNESFDGIPLDIDVTRGFGSIRAITQEAANYLSTLKQIGCGRQVDLFTAQYSPFFVAGAKAMAIQCNVLHPLHFLYLKQRSGPASVLVWNFKLPQMDSPVLRKILKRRVQTAFMKAMGEHGLRPNGTPIRRRKKIANDAAQSPKSELQPSFDRFTQGKPVMDGETAELPGRGRANTRHKELNTIRGTVRLSVMRAAQNKSAKDMLNQAQTVVKKLFQESQKRAASR